MVAAFATDGRGSTVRGPELAAATVVAATNLSVAGRGVPSEVRLGMLGPHVPRISRMCMRLTTS